MPTVTMQFTLPTDQHEYDMARLGGAAVSTLNHIEQRLRCLCKHGEPTDAERALAEEIRNMIHQLCPDALEL